MTGPHSVEPYRVVQWATGNIGARSLRAVVEHPTLSLAGLYVYAPDKVGRDAGELCGLPTTGVVATDDLEQIVALGADCVLYMPRQCEIDNLCRLLESGVNVVTTRGEFHHPAAWMPPPGSASTTPAGGATPLSTAPAAARGSSPRPSHSVLTSIQRQIEEVVIAEFADLSQRDSPELLFGLMGFGRDPGTFGDDRWSHGAQSFGPSLRLVAESLSLPLDSVEASGEIAVATRSMEIAAGTLEGGTVAGQRMRVSGMRGGRPLLSFVATWFCTTELEPAWDLGPTGWRISVVGDAPLEVEMRFAVPLESMGDWTPGYTANRAVNAVPFVCQAEPGIRTSVDLPQIIGTLRQGPVDRRARRSNG